VKNFDMFGLFDTISDIGQCLERDGHRHVSRWS